MILLILFTVLSLCVLPTVPQDKCTSRAPPPPEGYQPTSYMGYMDLLVGKLNLLLGLNGDMKGEGVSKSFFNEIYEVMEQGNNTNSNLTKGCVEGIMDLGKDFLSVIMPKLRSLNWLPLGSVTRLCPFPIIHNS